MKIENNNLDRLLADLEKYTPGGAVPGKAHVRDAAVYVLDTLELASEIASAIYTAADHPVVIDVYDRIDRERQRLEAAANPTGGGSPGRVMILPEKDIESYGSERAGDGD